MMPDSSSFPQTPGQSTIRLTDEGGILTLTNAPSPEALREQLQVLGGMADFVLRARPVVARTGSCFGTLFMAWGYLVLVFGVLFIGGMLAAVLVFNQPLNVNGAQVGKLQAAAFLAGFLLVWVTLSILWIWTLRRTMFNRDKLDGWWRLALGPEEWTVRRADVAQVIGRCRPADIEEILVAPNRRIVAQLVSGKKVALSGPLQPFDAAWLCDALTEALGRPLPLAGPVFPFVPAAEPPPQTGSRLAYRLICTDFPWKSLACVAALNLFWNGITGVFVYHAFWGEPQIQWGMALFLIPFELAGLTLLTLLGIAGWHCAMHVRIGRTTVEVSEYPLRAGSRIAAFVSQDGKLPLRRLRVHLACDEEADYRAGTTTSTDTKRVRQIDVFEQDEIPANLDRPFGSAFDLEVPADVMHSFAGVHNRIKWSLIVTGEFQGWPGFERHFPVVVHPSGSNEDATA